MDANLLYQKLTTYGDDWADKQSAYDALEGSKSSVLAKLMMASKANSVAAKEMEAKASPEFISYQEEVQKKQSEAIKAKVKYESIKIWIDLQRSQEATRRAEMRL